MIDDTGASPRCDCGGLIKARDRLLRRAMPETAMQRAHEAAAEGDLFLVIGFSLQVQPAATLPLIAKPIRRKARVVIARRRRSNRLADIAMHRLSGRCFRLSIHRLVSETFSSL